MGSRSMGSSFIERLEDRALLAGGAIEVSGTRGDDAISARVVRDQIVVQVNSKRLKFGVKSGKVLQINAGKGNDSVDLSRFKLPSIVKGGAGDDVIVGGTGSDSLSGGQGDDFLDGGAGADQLTGNGGSDREADAGDSLADLSLKDVQSPLLLIPGVAHLQARMRTANESFPNLIGPPVPGGLGGLSTDVLKSPGFDDATLIRISYDKTIGAAGSPLTEAEAAAVGLIYLVRLTGQYHPGPSDWNSGGSTEGGTLRGDGIINGTLTSTPGGVISPGEVGAIGSLSTSVLNLDGASLVFDINSGVDTNDNLIITSGGPTETSQSSFTFTKGGTLAAGQEFVLIDYAGTAPDLAWFDASHLVSSSQGAVFDESFGSGESFGTIEGAGTFIAPRGAYIRTRLDMARTVFNGADLLVGYQGVSAPAADEVVSPS